MAVFAQRLILTLGLVGVAVACGPRARESPPTAIPVAPAGSSSLSVSPAKVSPVVSACAGLDDARIAYRTRCRLPTPAWSSTTDIRRECEINASVRGSIATPEKIWECARTIEHAACDLEANEHVHCDLLRGSLPVDAT